MAKTVGESSLQYVGPYDGPETCCKIVGIDRYGGKRPCGVRATARYTTKSGGSVYLCERCKPDLIQQIRKTLDGFADLLGRASRAK